MPGSEESATFFEKLEVFLNTANQGLIAITTFYLMWHSSQSGDMWSPLSQHAWITAFGYQMLMAEGILTYYKANSLTRLSSRVEKNRIHWILQAVGGAMALYGCAIYIIERNRLSRRHFNSNHALYGLASMILVSISMVSGLASLFSIEIRRLLKPIMNKLAHNLISIAAFVTGMVSLILIWIDSGWGRRYDPGNLRFVSAWCLAFITVLTCIGALKSLRRQTVGVVRIFASKFDDKAAETEAADKEKC